MPVRQTDIIQTGGSGGFADDEPLSFDETVRRALAFCDSLPDGFAPCRGQLAELQTRLSGGRLHFAVLGQFNRGKSTFINALLGMRALPTSVLPLTSVPTIIEYGTERSCRIRFIDGKDDLVVTESIEVTLRQYVAEENNPKNRLAVKDATVTCASELLINGTVLIDTPGFGSTHLHNTQTTLDLLIECDAALFLLSADPPMTQTEMEFLRGVKERVPKLFFVLNKVDLLTPQGLGEVDRFIRNILHRELGFPSDTALYHTSAIKGEAAIQSALEDEKRSTQNAPGNGLPKPANQNVLNDNAWTQSGLETVKQQVLDFMVREKYFTLSDALLGKYGEAMASIKSLLEKKLGDRQIPIEAAREEISTITSTIQSMSLEMESEIKRGAKERDELHARISAWTKENFEPYTLSMKKALSVLLGDKYFPAEATSIASTLLPKHAGDLGAQLLGAMIEFANKSIRSLVMKHSLALSGLQKRYTVLTGGSVQPQHKATETLIGQFEISAVGHDYIFELTPWDIPQPQVMDIFRKRAARFEAIRQFYEPLCAKAISESIDKAAKQARSLVDTAWKNMQESISASYRQMIEQLNQLYKLKQGRLDKQEAEAKAEIVFLRERLRELKGLV